MPVDDNKEKFMEVDNDRYASGVRCLVLWCILLGFFWSLWERKVRVLFATSLWSRICLLRWVTDCLGLVEWFSIISFVVVWSSFLPSLPSTRIRCSTWEKKTCELFLSGGWLPGRPNVYPNVKSRAEHRRLWTPWNNANGGEFLPVVPMTQTLSLLGQTFFESSDTYAICPNSKCGFGFERVTANSAQVEAFCFPASFKVVLLTASRRQWNWDW